MSLATGDKVLLVIILTNFAGIFFWIGICLYLAYTKVDLILSHLKNSPAIKVWAPMREGGPWGKLLLIAGISGLVTFSRFPLEKGQLSADDLASFPADLKRKLIRLQWCSIWLTVVLVLFGIAVMLRLI